MRNIKLNANIKSPPKVADEESKSVTTLSSRDNSFYSFAHNFVSNASALVEKRRVFLHSLLQNKYYQSVIEIAGRYAGRRPTWHIETKLKERFQKHGFGNMFQDFDQLEDKDFTTQLKKGESLMTASVEFNGSRKLLIDAAQRVFNACKFPTLKFQPTTIDYAADNQINKASSSGYPFFRRKGVVLDEIKIDANLALMHKESTQWFFPCVRGFRLQLREDKTKKKNNISRKVRLMYPYPGALILLEDTFIIPFVRHFIANDTFYCIGRNGDNISKLIQKRLKTGHNNPICSLDVSAYDQNIVNEALICAFMILRKQLRLSSTEHACFMNLVQYFCTSIMVSKDSKKDKPYAFVKHHGIPSGSGFTNMIGTIAHAIILEYLTPGILEKDAAIICGDDNIFRSGNIDMKELFNGYKTIFNLDIDPKKTDYYKDSTNISFLGFNWIYYERHISIKLAVNQCLWHTDFFTDLDEYERHIARCSSILLNGKNGQIVFKKVFPEIIKILDEDVDIKFYYLTGYSPPGSKETPSMGTVPRAGRKEESLSKHLQQGYKIR